MDDATKPFDDPDDIPTTAVAKKPPWRRPADEDKFDEGKAPDQDRASKNDAADPKQENEH